LNFASRGLRLFSAAIHLHEKRFYIEQLGLLRSTSELFALAVWLFTDPDKEEYRTVAWQIAGLKNYETHIQRQAEYLLEHNPNAANREFIESCYKHSARWNNRLLELCERYKISTKHVVDRKANKTSVVYRFTEPIDDDYLGQDINERVISDMALKHLGAVLKGKPTLNYVTPGGQIQKPERIFPERMNLWFQEHFGDLDNPASSAGHFYRLESQVMHNDFPVGVILSRNEGQFEQITYYVGVLALFLSLFLTSVAIGSPTSAHGYRVQDISAFSQRVADCMEDLEIESSRLKREWEARLLDSER
jgi:hypothetical protein